jgi:putative membrane protein
MDGSVKKTPHQFTHLAVAGHGPATVDLPMSSSHLRRRSKGKKPDIVNGVAQVKVHPDGSEVDRLDSDYERPLPVSVKVTYKLNGHPISSDDIKGKSGTVETDYQLTNTTPTPVNVCFVGFNGKLVKKKVTAPSPILAYLSFNVPKNVAEFTAPKASIGATISGVGVSWTVALFNPLGSTTQTLSFTMHTPKAKIPKATLLIETLLPSSLTGQVPAQSAAIVGQTQAALAKVQNDVAAIELKASGSHPSSGGGRSAGRSGSGRSGSQSARAKPASAGRTTSGFSPPSLSFGTSPAALSQMQSQIATLSQANLTFMNNAGARTNALATSNIRSIDGLTASTNRSIDSLTASTNRSIDDETHSMRQSIDVLAGALRRSVDRRSLNRLTTNATRLQAAATVVGNHADALSAQVARLTTGINDLVAGLQPPAQDALRVYLAFSRIKRDLDAVSVIHKSGRAYLELVADLNTASTLAQAVSTSLNRLETEARGLARGVQTLQGDVTSLQRKITALVLASIANAQSTAQTAMTNAVSGLNARYTAAVASLNQSLSGDGTTAHAGVAAAQATAHRQVAAAETQATNAVTSELATAKASVASAQLNVSDVLTSVKAKAHADLAAAEQKAKQGGQALLAAAQASTAQATAKAQQALTTANDDYAQLLAIHQQAVANELPGGDATGVNVENGSLIYTIDGT